MRESASTQREWAIVELAEAQEAVLRHQQLLDLGLRKDAITRRLRSGCLHRKHQSVYTLGHRLLRPRGKWYAAVLAVPGCALSHQSAAAFYGWVESDPVVQHVTTIRKASSREGLQVHRVTVLSIRDSGASQGSLSRRRRGRSSTWRRS